MAASGMIKRGGRIAIAVAALTAAVGAELAQAKESNPPKRARPPKWSADVMDAFFADAREKLEGARPDYGQATAAIARDSDAGSSQVQSAAGEAGWSKAVDSDTLEAEIKRLAQAVAKDVSTSGAFKGGTFKASRRNFSLLAVLFAVSAEYDGEVRWQDVAAGLREQFARAGRNCKVGTDQSYQEATQRKQELADLIGGTRPKVPQAERKTANWAEVSDRPPLMQRLNAAHQERLTKWLASEREFAAHAEDMKHEAQVVAMIADVIGREGFDFWDDEQYAGYANELKQSAIEIAAAAEINNYQQARRAIGRATKACSDCHEGYRG